MNPNEADKHIQVILRNRPEHHDLWLDGAAQGDQPDLERMTKLKEKGVEKFDTADIDYIIFNSAASLGSEQTFHYFLPEFFGSFFGERGFGYSSDVGFIFNKLTECHFENWPKDSQQAALKLCLMGAELEQEVHMDFFDEVDENISLLIENIKAKIA